jgi:hypothetical protein
LPSAAIAAAVSSARLGTTSRAALIASGAGGYFGCGTAITWQSAAAAARSPFDESSTAAHARGACPSWLVTAR